MLARVVALNQLPPVVTAFLASSSSPLQIYQERIYDLLLPSGGSSSSAAAASAEPSLAVRESAVKGVYVDGLTCLRVGSAAEALAAVSSGLSHRRVGATAMNRESSRSHAVFSLRLTAREAAGGVTRARSSLFHLIDLAGSERQRATSATGERLKEAGAINKSLSALGNVIAALTEAGAGGGAAGRHVPYRDSKLTWLLKDR